MANSGYLYTCADAPTAPSQHISGKDAESCANCCLTFIAPLPAKTWHGFFGEVKHRTCLEQICAPPYGS